MTAKEYLMQIYRMNRRLTRLKRRRDEIRASMFSIGSPSGQMDADRVQTSLSGDSMLRAISKLDLLTREIDSEIAELEERKQRILNEIEQLSDERHRTILTDRYVHCWRWEAIAADVKHDLRYVYRLHGDALNAFAKIIRCG